jgi:hypothetical protein
MARPQRERTSGLVFFPFCECGPRGCPWAGCVKWLVVLKLCRSACHELSRRTKSLRRFTLVFHIKLSSTNKPMEFHHVDAGVVARCSSESSKTLVAFLFEETSSTEENTSIQQIPILQSQDQSRVLCGRGGAGNFCRFHSDNYYMESKEIWCPSIDNPNQSPYSSGSGMISRAFRRLQRLNFTRSHGQWQWRLLSGERRRSKS